MRSYLLCLLPILLCTCGPAPENAEVTTNPALQVTAENHDALMADLMPDKGYTHVKTIGILVYDGVNELDVFGPRYVLTQDMQSQLQLIALEPGPVTTVTGLTFEPNTTIDQVDSLDILIIPGGFRGTIEAAYDEEVLDWIRKIDQTTTFTSAICTGGWILGATGLLEGKRATTNWYRAEEYMTKYGAEFTHERFTRDGKIWTAAGVTAGMDMALAMLAELRGEAYAQGVMLDMEYDPAPPITGGSPNATPASVFQMMQGMYDMGVQPLVDSLEAARKR